MKKAPFELLMGYMPCIHQPERNTDIPTLGKRLSHIKEAREAAQEAQHKAQESWIKDKPYKPFVLGNKVWLEGTNLKLPANLTQKLSPRWYGPFEVAAIISRSAYQLKLPPAWCIHDVFHASLLMPYKETEQHGPNFLELPPDIIEGEPEWEVEQILQSRLYGHRKKRQYLVCWKGYSPSHDSWVDKSDMNTPDLVQGFHISYPAAVKASHNDNPGIFPTLYPATYASQDDLNNNYPDNSHLNNGNPVAQEYIKALELSDQDVACPLSESSSSEIPTSTVHSNTTSSNLVIVHTSPTPMHLNTPSSVKNHTAPITTLSNNTSTISSCPSTLTSPVQDSPLQLPSPVTNVYHWTATIVCLP